MPRKPLIRSHLPYHVTNRVNNREWFYLPPETTWEIFSQGCFEISVIYGAKVHAFVMMSNHIHLLISATDCDLGKIMAHFLGSVTRSFNRISGRTGHLFIGRYKWSLIDTPLYYALALKYVYRNPVKAGIVSRVEDYPFSTLYGILGNSPLAFPVSEPVNPLANYLVPQDFDELLNWLNTPFRNEDQEAIRKALRRKVFELPKQGYSRKKSELENGIK